MKKIASDCFIKYDSPERAKIDRSLDHIISKLENHFGDSINDIEIFGSYTRDTILPRYWDDYSDIDAMIVFNTDDEELKPESYRSRLKRFADKYYKNSLVVKSFPSIVVELNHIKFDLIPAVEESHWWHGDRFFIPNGGKDWLVTTPNEFNSELTKRNKKFDSIVKPIIRLIKLWNSSRNKPFDSYDLECQIAEMDFGGDNIESGFLYAIQRLSTDNLSTSDAKKVTALEKHGEWVEEYLDREDFHKAKKRLNKILDIA